MSTLKNMTLEELQMVAEQMQQDLDNKKLSYLEDLESEISKGVLTPNSIDILDHFTHAVRSSLIKVQQEIALRQQTTKA